MPRAAFDKVFEVYRGPDTFDPLGFRFSSVGRLVEQLQIHDLIDPFNDWSHWLTYSGPSSSAGSFDFDGTYYSRNLRSADIIYFPEVDRTFTVMVAQRIVPRSHIAYQRLLLLEATF